jgi:SpoVK/Ycf46/Vps4 family AAA+-type ATPase
VLPPAQPAAAVTVPRRGPPPAPYGGGGPSNSTASTSASSSAGATTPRNAHDLAQYQASVASARDAIRQIYEDDLRHTEEDTPPPNYDGSSRRSDPTPAPVQTVEEAAAAITAEGNTQQQLQQLRSHLHGLMHSAEIVDSILRDVVLPESISVTFQDIGALTKAKQILQEAVILPVLLPELFVGLREPWKGVLLFGPPGTGKTLLAKAVASLSSSTFINCSSATILCKYRGDSEKTIKCLFDAARACTPSILFIDEIDGLVGHKSGQNSEHEATRRLKTEFFTQMDGLSTTAHKNAGRSSINPDSKSNSVLVLATTNTPWELDEALRRRFEKRIYIALPDAPARKEIFQLYLEKMKTDDASAVVEGAAAESQCNLSSGDLDVLVSLSDGYSGADIYNVCREASMIPLRQFMASVPNPMDLALMKAQGKIVVPKVCSRFVVDTNLTQPLYVGLCRQNPLCVVVLL